MNYAKFLFFFLLLLHSFSANAYTKWFDIMGERYGVDPLLLQAIADQESTNHPWTLNLNKQPFFFDSKSEVLSFLDQVKTNPWLLEMKYKKKLQRMLFKTESDAKKYIRLLPLGSNTKLVKLNINYADIGLMQVNWHYNGKRYTQSMSRLLDIDFNIAASAHLLRILIDQYGLAEGVGRYHSSTPARLKRYSNKIMKRYEDKKRKRNKNAVNS